MTAVDCPSCADERAAGAAFCEACGRRVDRPTACPNCGGRRHRGRRRLLRAVRHARRAARATTSRSSSARPAAAVTDRGLRHYRNEDAVLLAARGADVDVVVCDGVSVVVRPGRRVGDRGRDGRRPAGPGRDRTAQARRAGHHRGRARRWPRWPPPATRAGPRPTRPARSSPPACAATEIGYGWVGDSRAYWLPADGPAEQLTEDDSWATHAIALGADPQAAMQRPEGARHHRLAGRRRRVDRAADRRRSGSPRPGIWCCAATACGTTSPTRQAFADTVRGHLRDRRPARRRPGR